MSQQIQSNVIRLTQPGAGQTVIIPINEDNMRLAVGFEPDPNAMGKNGQNLEFSFENGGELILEGYYDHVADDTLPVMIMESGDELPGEDFLASLREDLLTSAGPAASSSPSGGGSGEYVDDPGSLIEGVSRLGSLGTDYWARATVVPEDALSPRDLFTSTISITPLLPGFPGDPNSPTAPENPRYYIDAQGFNLKIDESYMPGGTNYDGQTTPVYEMQFLITTNNGLASVSVNGVPLSDFPAEGLRHNNGYLSNPQISDNGDGTFFLTFNYTQGRPEQHAPGEGKNISDNADSFVITATTISGATASATANVDIVDDIPWVSVDADALSNLGSAIVDESALPKGLNDPNDDNLTFTATLDAAAVQAQFVGEFGYDGKGSEEYSLTLSGSNVASGLYAVDPTAGNFQGGEIVLNQDGNVITGSVNGMDYFTIEINPATGEVKLTLLNNIWHSDITSHDEAEILKLAANTLMLTKTITDGDGDSASASLDLGAAGVFAFEDDGPQITLDLSGENNLTLTTHDEHTIGTGNNDTATADFGALILNAATIKYGADGEGSTVVDGYALSVDSCDSGLFSNGQAISLSLDNGVVQGIRADGTLVFTVSVDADGKVTLTQYEAIDHPTCSHNEILALTDGKISLSATITATDGDGDTASKVAEIDLGGNIRFQDHGPSIDGSSALDTINLLTKDAETTEGNVSTAVAGFKTAFEATVNYGGDGEGSTTVDGYALSVDSCDSGLFSNGEAIGLALENGVVQGIRADGTLVFTVSVDAGGKVTLTQYEAIDHPTGSHDEILALTDGKISLSATVTATDGDGDTASETVAIDLGGNIRFQDHGPVAASDDVTLLAVEYTVAGSVLTGDYETGNGRQDSSGAADTFGGDGEAPGADKCVFGSVITFTPANGSSAITLAVGNDGELTYNGQSYGTLALLKDGSGGYHYSRPSGVNIEGEISVGYTIMDRDGDTAANTLTLNVMGQKPITEIKAMGDSLLVHEDGLSWGTNAGDANHSISTKGYVEITSFNSIASITFVVDGTNYVIDLPPDWNGSSAYIPGPAGTFTVPLGSMVIDRIVLNTATGKYEAHFTYTLKTNTLEHSVAGDGTGAPNEHHDLLSDGDAAARAAMPQIGVVVKDTAGYSSDSSTIAIDVHDDGPELVLDHAQTGYQDGQCWVDDALVHLDNSYMTTGTIEPNYGADRAYGAGDDYLLVSFSGIRSVMVNGQPFTDSVVSNEPIEVPFDASGKATVYTGLGMIEFARQSDGSITYRYIAKHGLKGDHEEITFTVMDGDRDVASQAMQIMMDHNVPAGTSYVDEASLATQGPDGYAGIGSFHTGYGASSQTFTVFLPEGTTGFTWDLAAINGNPGNAISADANGDGIYTPVTWSVDASGNLIGMAEGHTILTVKPPQSDSNGPVLQQDSEGNWYGTMESSLEYPIQHAAPPVGTGSDYNVLGLYLGFKATSPGDNGGTQVTSNAVSVAVIDDAPSARDMTLTVVEAVKAPEDVYLVMDVSGSINARDLTKGMQALQALVQKYVSEGIEAKFTLVTFGSDALVRGEHLSATEMLALLQSRTSSNPSTTAANWRSGHSYMNTNYDEALDAVQHLITAAQQDGALRYYDQKVYFISDGAPNTGIDSSFTSWKAFTKDHGADTGNEQVEVYAVGVGGALGNQANWNTLMQVTDDGSDHGIKVNDYADLANKLTALIVPGKTTGNLFGVDIDNNDTRSADLTTVVSVEVNGIVYEVQANGTTVDITIGTGVTLRVYANGNYTITSTASVDGDRSYDLKYTIKDADGDTSTADLQLVLKDAKPEAFDNVAGGAEIYTRDTAILLDDFDTANGWYSANSDTAYNQTRTGTYTDIHGTTQTLGSNDGISFVKIPAVFSPGDVTFNHALQQVTGKTCAQLFGTADSPHSGSYIEKSFDLLADGTVKFNYVFAKGNNDDTEKAFWILLDEHGNVHKSGLITSTSLNSSGLISIPVENAGQYTLVLGCYDTYSVNPAPALYVDQVVYVPGESGEIYNGNVIEDTSPLGAADNLADHAVLHTVRFTDKSGILHEYTVGEGAFVSGLLVLEGVFAAGDKLTFNSNGNYVYQAVPGSSFDDVNIEYAIKEPDSNDIDWATLYVRSSEYRHDGVDLDQRAAGADHSHVIIGADAADTIYASDGGDIIYGGLGDDTIYGGLGSDIIHTGDGNNIVFGGSGNDVIYGGSGNDILYGGDGNDILYGGDGNDILYGGKGDDILYGGSGSDIFAWKAEDFDGGNDVIMDFTLREDRLSFADIFGVGEQNNISGKAILEALQDHRIDISAESDTLLRMSVDDNGATQNVEIHLSGSSLNSDLMAAIGANDEAAKAILLQQMLTSITG